MTNSEYKETYNMAPYDLEDYAHGASTITDNDSLQQAAKAFLLAKLAFESELEFNEIELG